MPAPTKSERARARLLLFSVLIVATCGLIYELITATMASYLLGDSVTQFSLVIGVYLSAMGVGSWLSRFFEKRLVESASRPDGARDTPRFFDALHRGQQFVQLDFSSPREIAVLRELLMQADVVIEGSRPRALRQLGIRAEEITSTGPRAWISITAHGRHDEWGRRVGFGDDAAAAGGLVWNCTGGPMFVGDAIADPLTGLVAAAVAVDVLASGRRVVADVALARVAGDDRLFGLPGLRTAPGAKYTNSF